MRRSQAQWRELFREQDASGLSVAAYCRDRGVCPKYFSLRRRQLSREEVSDNTTATASAFVPVAVRQSADAPTLEVRLGTMLSLRVPLAVSPCWLIEVLHGLRG